VPKLNAAFQVTVLDPVESWVSQIWMVCPSVGETGAAKVGEPVRVTRKSFPLVAVIVIVEA
jgi:hypothetical protein